MRIFGVFLKMLVFFAEKIQLFVVILFSAFQKNLKK